MKRSILLATLCLVAHTASWADDYEVSSPDGLLSATVRLADGQMSYTVARQGKTIVAWSPLGLNTNIGNMTEGLEHVSHSVAGLDESYLLATGKQRQCHNQFRQLTLTAHNPKADWNISLLFRLYNDGFAFRYVLPKKGNATRAQIQSEASRVRVGGFRTCVASRFDNSADYYHPNIPYESNIGQHTWAALRSQDPRVNAPALVSTTTGTYLLLSEAENIGTYSTAMLQAEKATGEFSFAYSGDQFDMDRPASEPRTLTVQLPLKTPWRMAIVGTLPQVFASVMSENLCAPSQIKDASWVRPGVVSWDWGGVEGGNYTPRRVECDAEYTDLAVDMGWPYLLVDGGWNTNVLPDIMKYAREKDVDIILWQTAKLKDSQQFSTQNMARTLDQWKAWGVKGVKIDFWEDDSRTTMERMELLLKLCADRQMLVNFHGCTRPSGLRRTWPHLMTQEAIMGGEQNFWNNKFMTAEHHINLFFTRNVTGAADYTPGDMIDDKGTLVPLTTVAHRMGLLTGFESPLVHIAESPEALRYFEGRDIYKRIPTVWDESRLLEGEPSKFATIARRNGDDWWISGAAVPARMSNIKLDFLPQGKEYTAYIYKDGSVRSEMLFEKRTVDSQTTLSLRQAACGGFLVQLSPQADLPVPAPFVTYEAESSQNLLQGGARTVAHSPIHCSGGKQVHDLGNGSSLTFRGIKASNGPGQYVLTIYYNTADDRHILLSVNGAEAVDHALGGNGKRINVYAPEGMGLYRTIIDLKEGDNQIAFLSKPNWWSPNIDRITLAPLATTPSSVGLLPATTASPITGPVYTLSGQQVAQHAQGFRGNGGVYLLRRADGTYAKQQLR